MSRAAKKLQRGFGFESKPGSDEWFTPAWLFEAMALRFDLDPCGHQESPAFVHATIVHTVADGDGLDKTWAGRVWLNPPYSNLELWIAKFIKCARGVYGITGVTLTYCRTERPWAQQLMAEADCVLFLGKNPDDGKRRVGFIPGPNNPAREKKSSPGGPSMLCAFGEAEANALRCMARSGHGVALAQPQLPGIARIEAVQPTLAPD